MVLAAQGGAHSTLNKPHSPGYAPAFSFEFYTFGKSVGATVPFIEAYQFFERYVVIITTLFIKAHFAWYATSVAS